MIQKNNRFEEFGLISIIFSVTVLIIRVVIFFYSKNHIEIPSVAISGFYFHRYLMGFFLIAISFAVFYIASRQKTLIHLLLFGAGLGFVFDEFSSWFFLLVRHIFGGGVDFRNYWLFENFFAILALEAILFSLTFLSWKKERIEWMLPKLTYHKNSENPLVSLVIPAFNEEKFLPRTLNSVLNQDFKDFELIVVDNNSNDNTSNIAKDFGAKVLFESKQGVGWARQKGFAEARGKIIATTDADTILPKDWLERIAKEFSIDEKLVAFGGPYKLYSGPFVTRIIFSYFLYQILFFYRLISGGWSLPGVNLAVKKEAFAKIGGFATELECGEDDNFSHRLKQAGKVNFDPSFKVYTSGRRFKNSLFSGLMTYIPNVIIITFLKRKKSIKFPAIRVESPLFNRFSFSFLFLSVIFLFSLFYLKNPAIAKIEDVKLLKKEIIEVQEKLKIKTQKIKSSINYIKNNKLDHLIDKNIESWKE